MTPTPQDSFPYHASDSEPDHRFGRLHTLGRVGLRADACLHLHKPHVGCTACIKACPHGGLEAGENALALDPERCTACGLCAAACPTGALRIEDFGLKPVSAGSPVVIACERARSDVSLPAAIMHRVPCLGGVELNDYLRLSLRSHGAPLTVIDDGSCERCPTARGQGNPGLRAVDTARKALEFAGAPADALPRPLRIAALPDGNPAAPAAARAPSSARRAFFSGLSRALAGQLARCATTAPAPLPKQVRVAIPNVRGDDTRALLTAVAQRHGRGTPQLALLPRLAASTACDAHGACVRACPTGALELENHDGQATLHFSPWQCISCGICSRFCPADALHPEEPAWSPFVDSRVAISRVAMRECAECGAALPAHDDAELCDRCNKSRRLAQAAFSLFHPGNRESPTTPDPR